MSSPENRNGNGCNEFRVAGPPGTGKTDYLTKQIGLARQVHGDDGVMVVSFTRNAATEIAGRIGYKAPRRKKKPEKAPESPKAAQSELPGTEGAEPAPDATEKRVGTLHSILWYRLGQPVIAESMIEEWNAANKNRPDLRLSESSDGETEDLLAYGTSQGTGDLAFQAIQRLRAKQLPLELWPIRERQFFRAWTLWKNETGYLDFTDLIEVGVRDNVAPPYGTKVCVVDEAQDFTKLELAMVRNWAGQMDRAILAYDDDQSIFSFKGASPEALLDIHVPDANRRVLSQSWRVPIAVHRLANAWIRKVSRRDEKEYRPRPSEGEVCVSLATSRSPIDIIRGVEKDLAAKRSTMILGSCSYLLGPIIKALREASIPFHNPARVRRGDWNPLRFGTGSTGSRVWLFAQRNPSLAGEGAQIHVWTAKELSLWSEHLSAEIFRERGAKKRLHDIAVDKERGREPILEGQFFSDDAMRWIETGDLEAFKENLLGSKRNSYSYAIGIAKRNLQELKDEPKTVIGTIHSVKGMESDSVYLLPDLSPEAMRRWSGVGKSHDEVRRVFYVGFTRARERLTLCGPSSRSCVRWER